MKKLYETSDLPRQEDQEQIRRLYRYISDAARRLDESRGRACTVGDLFTTSLLSQRSRLRDHCEKLIFTHPLTYGHKCEELLWRKGYYDIVSSAKRIKQQTYAPEDVAHLDAHINAGIGHYHHIVSRLQIEYDLNLFGVIDFPIVTTAGDKSKNLNEKQVDWAKSSLHRCLIYLGDLSRYRLEINTTLDPALAIRYYVQASNFNPDLGIPHNQLGTLAIAHNYSLDAAYHYMRCLSCPQPFDGAEGNLVRLFEKNASIFDEISVEKESDAPEPINHIKRLISRFLLLIYVWFFDKDIQDLHSLCQQTLIDLQSCISYPKPVSSESEDSIEAENSSSDLLIPQYIRPDIIFKMVVMCLLCISKLQEKPSPRISAIVAFTLAIYSQLVKNVIQRIQDSVLNLSILSPEPDKLSKKKKSILKMHRRRKRINSSEDSDLSDADIPYNSSSSDCNSDISENEEPETSSVSENSDESDSDEKSERADACVEISVQPAENDNEPERITESVKKLRKLDPNDVLELIADENVLQSIKVLSDWLRGDIEIIKACGQSSRILIQRIVQLINLLNVDTKNRHLDHVKVDAESLDQMQHTIALPEDLVLKNVSILISIQKNINWEALKKNLYLPKEEALIRLYKLVDFGHFLKDIPETGVSYNSDDRHFEVADIIQNCDDKNACNDHENEIPHDDGDGEPVQPMSRGELMKSMGQLWLAAEVRDLECKVRGRTALSPYLVLDTDALILHTHLVKQLVAARKFIVVVPSIVVSGLDELKRETGKARDAIRWLEAQFQRGNRFLRAQRNHEHAAIPLIKYPKKRDKQAFTYIQIIECCYFLTKQQKDSSDLVTLLTGKPTSVAASDSKEISYTGLARSAGIALELITTFHAKWKKSLKGQR